MSGWIRLYVTVEGQAEKAFVDAVLKPHLAGRAIEVCARVVVTNRKLSKRGGVLDFERIRSDLEKLMRQESQSDARFTTMIDLYALPQEFPGWSEARKQTNPLDRVRALEQALATHFAEPRFIPFIQLHEFEAMLFCDLDQLRLRVADSESGIADLKKEVQGLAPEEINEGPTSAPSKRIIRHLPIYEKSKVRVGATTAAAIGLPTLRSKCPHFGDWVSRLEALGQTSLAG